jgi:starvation-inducible DNA-binding protein
MTPDSKNGLTGRTRQAIASILNHVLEDECQLSATTRACRWKVTGPNFHSLHRLFDEQRKQIDYWLDQVMARTRAMGLATVEEKPTPSAAETAGDPPGLPPAGMIGELLERHEKMARQLRADVEACGIKLGDRGTAELLKRLGEFHETTAWMLRTLLNSSDAAKA